VYGFVADIFKYKPVIVVRIIELFHTMVELGARIILAGTAAARRTTLLLLFLPRFPLPSLAFILLPRFPLSLLAVPLLHGHPIPFAPLSFVTGIIILLLPLAAFGIELGLALLLTGTVFSIDSGRRKGSDPDMRHSLSYHSHFQPQPIIHFQFLLSYREKYKKTGTRNQSAVPVEVMIGHWRLYSEAPLGGLG
jgi:hypothetical protein